MEALLANCLLIYHNNMLFTIQAAELERDRKEAAKRTLELMEVGHRWAQRNRIRQLFHL